MKIVQLEFDGQAVELLTNLWLAGKGGGIAVGFNCNRVGLQVVVVGCQRVEVDAVQSWHRY